MLYICVICTLNRPPLLPLAIEHRRLLEAIVSPFMNMDDLKASHLLLCVECQVKIMSVHKFQKTALDGIRNLKYMYSTLNIIIIPPSLQTITIEDDNPKPGNIKIEPETETPAMNNSTAAPLSEEVKTEPVSLKMESRSPVELDQNKPELDTVRKSARIGASIDKPTTNSTPKVAKARKAANTTKIMNTRQSANSAKTETAKYNTRSLRFECQVCQKSPNDRSLQEHVDIVHLGLRKYKCGKGYARGAGLRHHTRAVHEKREMFSFVCDLCGKAFRVTY